MMHFEYGLVDRLVNEPQVARFLGDRVAGVPQRQGTPAAYLVYRRITQDRSHYISGKRTGVVRLMYQIEVWDTDPDQCGLAADEVETCLDGYRGWMLGCFVKRLRASVQSADDEADEDSSDGYWYRRRIEVVADVDENRQSRPVGYQE